jgi:hypothetical protein
MKKASETLSKFGFGGNMFFGMMCRRQMACPLASLARFSSDYLSENG